MKVNEIIGPQQLDEINLRHAAAAGIASAALMGAPHTAKTPTAQPGTRAVPTAQQLQPVQVTAQKRIDPQTQKIIDRIVKLYDQDPEFVQQVVDLAEKYQKPGFPTAHDLLAIIAVESDFDPEAVSHLRSDPAVGLMQVRPGKWGMDPQDLKDPETSIRVGSAILHKYYRHLGGDKKAAIQAYNVGLTDYRQGVESPNYLMKVAQRLKHITSM